MPKRLPMSILLKGVLRTLTSILWRMTRHLLVGFSWFILLPWSIMAPFRFYFGWGILEAMFPEAKGNVAVFGGEFAVPRLILDVIGGLLVFGGLVFAVLGLTMLKDYMVSNGMLNWPRVEEPEEQVPPQMPRTPMVMRNEFNPQAHQQQQGDDDDEDQASQRSEGVTGVAGPRAANNWLSQVSPREYRTFLRRRELFRERQAQRLSRNQFETVAQQNVELLRNIEAGLSETESGMNVWESVTEDQSDVETAFGAGTERTNTETFDPYNLDTIGSRAPRGPLSNPSLSNGDQPTEASSLRRSVARTETFREPTVNGVSFRENIRCRVCGSRTCVDREHVIQASQRYYQERQQQAAPMPPPPAAAPVLQAPVALEADLAPIGEDNLNLLPFININIDNDGAGGAGMDFPEIVGLRGPIGNLFIHLSITMLFVTLCLHGTIICPMFIGLALVDNIHPSWVKTLVSLIFKPRPEAEQTTTALSLLFPIVKQQAVLLSKAFVHHWDSSLISLSTHWPNAARFRPQHLKLFLLTVKAHIWQTPGPFVMGLVKLAIGYGALIIFYVALYHLCVYHLRMSGPITKTFFTTLKLLAAFLKMSCMLFVMLVVFPLWAGSLIDLCTLSLFRATLMERLVFHQSHPFTSLCIHHILGMFFTTSVSYLIVTARKHVRPGLLYFIRNPDDPEDHLVKDILQKPFWRQMANTAPSFVFYSAVIAVFFGLVSRVLTALFPEFFPIYLNFTEPLSTIPLDIILQAALKVLFDAAKPEALSKHLLPQYFKWFLRRLRLSSYILGGRFLAEESFPKGGQWVFVPDFDRAYPRERLREVMSRRVQPIDIARLPIVEARGSTGSITPNPVDFSQIPVPRRPAFRSGGTGGARRKTEDATKGFTVVFRPNFFWPRLFVLLGAVFFLWLVLSLIVVVLPILVGRWMASWITDSRVHECYTFAVGALTCGSIARALVLLHQSLSSSDRATLHRLAIEGPIRLLKASVIVAVFGLLWPLLFGTYTFLLMSPLLSRLDAIHVWGLGTVWSVGMLGVKALLLLAMPPFISPERAAAIAQLKQEGLWSSNLNLYQLTRVLIVPITIRVLALAICPPLFILLAASLFSLPASQTLALQSYSHLISLTLPISLLLLEHILAIRRRLVARIRDEHYLVGRQLHNLELPNLQQRSMSVRSVR